MDYSPWEHDLVRAICSLIVRTRRQFHIAIRASADLRSIIPAVKAALHPVDPDQPVYDVLPYARDFRSDLDRLRRCCDGVLGLMALVISTISVSDDGVLCHAANSRNWRMFLTRGLTAINGLSLVVG